MKTVNIKLMDYNDLDNPKEVEIKSLSQAIAIMEDDKNCWLEISDNNSAGEITLAFTSSVEVMGYRR